MEKGVAKSENRCAECGVVIVDGITCQDQLTTILGWEGQDPELFRVHFYTVASFNLQHPAKFTNEALTELRTNFIQVFDGKTTLDTLAQRMESKFEGNKRVLKDEEERRTVLQEWLVTISDVYNSGRPDGASYRVRRWASTIRKTL